MAIKMPIRHLVKCMPLQSTIHVVINWKVEQQCTCVHTVVCIHSDSGEDSINRDQWKVLIARGPTTLVLQPLHLSSYLHSSGPAWVIALWGARQDYCDRSFTLNPPLWNLHRHIHIHAQYSIEANSYHADASRSVVICFQWEEQENWLQENNRNTTESAHTAICVCPNIVLYTPVRPLPYGLPYRH